MGIDHQLQPGARRRDRRQRRPSPQRERAESGHLGEAADRLVFGDLHGAFDPPAPVGPDQPGGGADPYRPGEVWMMAVTAGSHLGWFWKWSVAMNRNTSADGRSMTWDAESRTPPPPAGTVDAHGLLTRLADRAKNRAGRLPVGKPPDPR
jgi:hypothetical protein